MWVCRQCGLAGWITTCLATHGELPLDLKYERVATFHTGECEICKRTTSVTQERDYFYPNWKLIQKSSWRKALNKLDEK